MSATEKAWPRVGRRSRPATRGRWTAVLLAALVLAAAAGLTVPSLIAQARSEPAAAGSSGPDEREAAWLELFSEIGVRPPAGKGLAELLGPLPGETAYREAGSLTPGQFAALYRISDERTRLVMRRLVKARLRELSRRGVLDVEGVAALLGPEAAGVHGSMFFGIPPVPEESYRALISYLEFMAMNVPGGGFEPTPELRELIDRHLQVSLAISSPAVRVQYRDFDAVWSGLLMGYVCAAGPRQDPAPGLFWLYFQLRDAVGLDFLPEGPAELREQVAQEGGELFQKAREQSAAIAPSLASVTQWSCLQGNKGR